MNELLGWTLGIAIVAAWVTHIMVGIAAKAWLFMIMGALIAPVAIAHGVAVWFGFNWL
jgi:hypothetical protein|tara:strand:- start:225 stop:398 length:174 start_codon:yes stop_codon:yes gene_type:complete